jgi:transcription antitermination factor NusG
VTTTATTGAAASAIASTGALRLAEGAAHSLSQGAQGEQALLAEPHWYAAYTCAQHEKRVAEQLKERAVEQFLPLYASVRRWKDRRMRLELPLFPGYVFVFLALRDRLSVLQVPGVVHLVSFGGHPARLDADQMETLRKGLKELRAEPHPYLTVGRRVRIRSGPLQDTEGILLRRKNRYRVILCMDLIMRSVAVEVDIADLELLAA